jgi:hypothetical protein
MKHQYTLVLQFPGKSMELDEMIELGDSIAKHLQDKKDESRFDGHDIGSGQIDFFICTNNPQNTFECVNKLLGKARMKDLKAAYRKRDKDGYATGKHLVVWPEGLKKFRVK